MTTGRPSRPALACMAAVAAACFAMASGASAERLELQRVGTGASVAQATERYGAFQRTDGDVQVLDARGRRRGVVDPPDGCARSVLGGAHLLATCGAGAAEPVTSRSVV